MSDDLLDRATRALRDESRVEPRDLEATRARLLADVRKTRRQRSRVIQWAIPIAAVLALGTAYAAATGRLRAWVMPNSAPPAASTTAPAAPLVTAPPRPTTVVLPVASSSVEPAPTPAPSVVASASAVASALAPPSAAPTIAAVVAPSTSASDAMGADLAAYRKAHALHFVEKRWDAALDAWNAYLAANPKGTFALEARYNRAICLVKLGRKAEARVALTPFADGLVGGGYRQTEAKALLDALDTP